MNINIELMEHIRKKNRLSMSKVSKMIGYKSEAAYQHKIKGRRKFTIDDLINISLILKIDLKKLLKFENKRGYH